MDPIIFSCHKKGKAGVEEGRRELTKIDKEGKKTALRESIIKCVTAWPIL